MGLNLQDLSIIYFLTSAKQHKSNFSNNSTIQTIVSTDRKIVTLKKTVIKKLLFVHTFLFFGTIISSFETFVILIFFINI